VKDLSVCIANKASIIAVVTLTYNEEKKKKMKRREFNVF